MRGPEGKARGDKGEDTVGGGQDEPQGEGCKCVGAAGDNVEAQGWGGCQVVGERVGGRK